MVKTLNFLLIWWPWHIVCWQLLRRHQDAHCICIQESILSIYCVRAAWHDCRLAFRLQCQRFDMQNKVWTHFHWERIVLLKSKNVNGSARAEHSGRRNPDRGWLRRPSDEPRGPLILQNNWPVSLTNPDLPLESFSSLMCAAFEWRRAFPWITRRPLVYMRDSSCFIDRVAFSQKVSPFCRGKLRVTLRMRAFVGKSVPVCTVCAFMSHSGAPRHVVFLFIQALIAYFLHCLTVSSSFCHTHHFQRFILCRPFVTCNL